MREKATADRSSSRAKRVLKSHQKEQRRTRTHEGFAATSARPVTLAMAKARTRIAEAEAASR